AGLPDPADENDLFDLGRLKILGHNFAVRSKLFIILALIDLAIIMFISTKLEIPNSAGVMAETICKKVNLNVAELKYYVGLFQLVIFSTLKAVAIFVFLECIYTFYRLAETILAVIEIRKSYVETKISIEHIE
ncbi:hypothetical protein, partial [Sphingomonas sp. 28-62-11]|uniref:hypothetical protein n=1 Tax=Sphingomonas sp. 28-62-11 TaxID=1970432 RepID=UPI0035A8461A